VERTTECKAFWYGDGGEAAGSSANRKKCVLSTKVIDHEKFDYDNPHYPKRAYPKGADGQDYYELVEYVQYPDTTQLTCTHKREHNRKHWIVATCKTYVQKQECEANHWCFYTPLTFPYGAVFELIPAQELKFKSGDPSSSVFAEKTRGMIAKGKAMCPDPAGTEFTFKRDSITGFCPSAENCIRLATGKQYSVTEYAVLKSTPAHLATSPS
jgi:hypothetical protein